MKGFVKLLLMVIWLLFSWITYGQDWASPTYEQAILKSECACWLPPIALVAIYCLIWVLLLSILMMPSWWIFKKAWKIPWKSLIPIQNLYILSGVTTSKILQLFSSLMLLALFWIFVYGTFIYPISSYSNCCKWDWIIWMNLWIFALFLCIFIIQFYCLARRFGLKVFYSALLALFFPIWVRILSFGNYKYINNKEDNKNLES